MHIITHEIAVKTHNSNWLSQQYIRNSVGKSFHWQWAQWDVISSVEIVNVMCKGKYLPLHTHSLSDSDLFSIYFAIGREYYDTIAHIIITISQYSQ